MADQARKKTDKILNSMEKEVSRIYTRASKEISEEWNKYMTSHKKILDQAYNDLNDAKKLGDKEAIKLAQEKYDRTVRNITFNNNRYKAMVNETAARLSHVNEIALDYVNGNIPKIYTINYNEFANQDIKGYSFTIINEQAVRILATEDKSLLPKKKIDVPKDIAWNTKKINSEVLQGILQGESIPKIAKRLTNVTNMNRNSSIRNARTMVTGAENKGRQDSYVKATNDGIIMEREWVATFDERTRAWHADLNGVRVSVDEPWENDYGKIMYPGDPTAEAGNVYNCRCAIRAHIKGFAWNKENEKQSQYNEYKDLDYSDLLNRLMSESKEKYQEFMKIMSDQAGSYSSAWMSYVDGTGSEKLINDLDKLLVGNTKTVSAKAVVAPKKVEEAVVKASKEEITNPILDKINKFNVEPVEVSRYDQIPSMDNIIKKISGGDETEGSCASLAYCYCAQRNGLDVSDFRGGDSRKVFSTTTEAFAKLPSVNGKIIKHRIEADAGVDALQNVEKNKEYILSVGRHSAVVRKTGRFYEYLELQSSDPVLNRWKALDRDVFIRRFGCSTEYDEDGVIATLVSRDSLKNNKDFESMLKYINTSEKNQLKGVKGDIK